MKRWFAPRVLRVALVVSFLVLLLGWAIRDRQNRERRVVVTEEDLEGLRRLWRTRSSNPPTAREIETLLDEHVREEILYREALKLGLDRKDPVIRRRLVQKMQAVIQSGAEAEEPSESQLREWFAAHQETYQTPARLSFVHVFFNPDAPDAGGRAERLLSALRAGGSLEYAIENSDRFLLPHEYSGESIDGIKKTFGPEFASQLHSVESGVWSGPHKSGYGMHLVLVKERFAAASPDLADIRGLVLRDWRAAVRQQAEEERYEELRAEYEIVGP